jgi:hypothetical protein
MWSYVSGGAIVIGTCLALLHKEEEEEKKGGGGEEKKGGGGGEKEEEERRRRRWRMRRRREGGGGGEEEEEKKEEEEEKKKRRRRRRRRRRGGRESTINLYDKVVRWRKPPSHSMSQKSVQDSFILLAAGQINPGHFLEPVRRVCVLAPNLLMLWLVQSLVSQRITPGGISSEEVQHVSRKSVCPYCIDVMAKRVTLSQHVTHVIPPIWFLHLHRLSE